MTDAAKPFLRGLPGGTATGVGSWPGADADEAARIVLGELAALPHLVELPARGVGADMVGRTAALLVDLAVEVAPSGYRVASRPGRDHRRAVDLLRRDLDVLEEALERAGATPPALKVQVAGPWTMAAQVELRSGHRLLTDRGAVAEVTASLAEGVAQHVAEVQRRTGIPVVLQVDEPGLPGVLAGALPTVSGLTTIPAVPAPEVEAGLRTVLEQAPGRTMVHCCAAAVPLTLIRRAGATAVGVDLGLVGVTDLDEIGETLEDGAMLVLGVVPVPVSVPASGGASATTLHQLAEPALRLMDRLGFPRSVLSTEVLVTPGCGLAGSTPADARRLLAQCVELGRAFTDPPESWGM
ncbi:methionine synthase [Rhodococcus sp. X156]|uniref:methionine synthase n=1 Tax=Rhodococcus sp. X156 TaxID=2499145 RepID=UPI000FD75BD5|nr:methionine synthase [Rhodococcus sp. X156]